MSGTQAKFYETERSFALLRMTAAGSRFAHARRTPSLCQFVSCEKETEFKARGILRIGAVDRIVLDIRGPLLANCAFLCIRRVSRAHEFAQIGDGMFFFQSENDNWSARHEVG